MSRFARPLKTVVASLFACMFLGVGPGHAGVVVYTDRTQFLSALGGGAGADDFESYAQGAVGNNTRLGDFDYSFSPAVQPGVVPGGYGGQALGGPYDAFVGGDALTVGYTGTTLLRAFGMDVGYAPSFDTVLADIYRLRVGDGSSAGSYAGNTPLDSGGGRFFLGLIADAGSEFRQLDLLSVVPLDVNGDPVLVPAYQIDNFTYAAQRGAPVPEPATLALVALAGAVLAGGRRRRAGRTQTMPA